MKEVRRHLRVVQPHVPDVAEVPQQLHLLGVVLEHGDPTVLKLLHVLKLPRVGEDRLGKKARLLVVGIGLQSFEQQGEKTVVLGSFLLKDARRLHVQSGQLRALVRNLGPERIVFPGKRLQLGVGGLYSQFPVAAVVERLLKSRLVLLVVGLGVGGRTEVLLGVVDVAQVELRGAEVVAQLRFQVWILIGLELQTHQARHHLQVRHVLVDRPSSSQRFEVALIELERLLVRLHRTRFVEEHLFTGARQVEERFRLSWLVARRAGFRFELVDHGRPFVNLAKALFDPLGEFHVGAILRDLQGKPRLEPLLDITRAQRALQTARSRSSPGFPGAPDGSSKLGLRRNSGLSIRSCSARSAIHAALEIHEHPLRPGGAPRAVGLARRVV